MKVNNTVRMTETQYRHNLYKLYRLIEKSDLNPSEICRNCGITRSALYRIQTGKNLGDASTWDKFSKYFNYQFEFTRKYEIKNKPKKRILLTVGDYVIPLLKNYGNAYIGEKRVKRFGKEAIIDELEKIGIKCCIRHADEAGGYILEVIH